jgi:hypothetical protein
VAEEKVVTQAEVNKYYKMAMEAKEKAEVVVGKLDKSEAEKVELISRIKKLEEDAAKRPPLPARTTTVEEDEDLTKVYTIENPPVTKEEWQDLSDYDPRYAMELERKLAHSQETIDKTVTEQQKTLQEKHPDMYLRKEDGSFRRFKVGPDGNYVRDPSGKFIDDDKGLPMLDQGSEKGKIWVELAADKNFLRSPRAIGIIMGAMENKVKAKKEKEMSEKLKKEKEEKENKRQDKVDKTKGADGGNQPPIDDDKIEVKYNSEEERKHVLEQISKGRYKDEKDYMKHKNKRTVGQGVGYGRGGF